MLYLCYQLILIIAVLLVIITGQYLWPTPDQPIDESKYIKIGSKRYKILTEATKVKYITIKTVSPTYIPMPIELSTPVMSYYPTVIDTAAVIASYYTKNYYEDVQKIDTLGTVKIKDGSTEINGTIKGQYNHGK